MLSIEGDSITLKGLTAARIFRRGHPPIEVAPGANLNELLSTGKQEGSL